MQQKVALQVAACYYRLHTIDVLLHTVDVAFACENLLRTEVLTRAELHKLKNLAF